MQNLQEQKKLLEEEIASKEKAIELDEMQLSVKKQLLKHDKSKLKVLIDAITPAAKIENALNKDEKEVR